MVDEADLETNVLEFTKKSFSFDRTIDADGVTVALFHRTETESESRFRPKILRLWLALPTEWIALDLAAERLIPAKDGRPASAPSSGEALEAAAQPSRFEEAGIRWRREPLSEGGFFYLPEEFADRWLSPAGLARLGLTMARP